MSDLAAIFKAYDVRGLVPSQLDADAARLIGSAFACEVGADQPGATVVIGHDMRPTSPELSDAFATGVRATGADVIHIGLASTDQLYFASGSLGLPGTNTVANVRLRGHTYAVTAGPDRTTVVRDGRVFFRATGARVAVRNFLLRGGRASFEINAAGPVNVEVAGRTRRLPGGRSRVTL